MDRIWGEERQPESFATGQILHGLALLPVPESWAALAQPNAIFDKSITAGVHDAVETGVPAFSEGIFCVLDYGLYGLLNVEQGLS